MKIIMKFGGSVLDNPSKINTIIDLTHSFKNMNGTKNDIICVISALSKVTDKILSLTDPIMKGNRDSIKIFIDKMTSIHIDLIEKTITNDSLKLEAKRIVLSILSEFHDILNGLVLISEITPRSLDQTVIIRRAFDGSYSVLLFSQFKFKIRLFYW